MLIEPCHFSSLDSGENKLNMGRLLSRIGEKPFYRFQQEVINLELSLTEPQKRHFINLTDGILVTEGKKTLANIQRQFVEAPDPSNMADFLRISPWDTEMVRRRMQRFMVK
jgi:hypothetical protein